MKTLIAIALPFALSASVMAAPAAPLATAERPSTWATPLKMDGLPNLHRVSDTLLRSAQPTKQGMQNLGPLKVKTVVNLRSFHSDRDELGEVKTGYEHITMKAWHPEYKEAVRFLKIATDPTKTPVLVHCQHGADRTGTMCALYRVAVQGWSKEDALREMTGGGFGYHKVWVNLPSWFKDLDIDALRKDAGIAAPAAKGDAATAPQK